jgi:hypothetical protein
MDFKGSIYNKNRRSCLDVNKNRIENIEDLLIQATMNAHNLIIHIRGCVGSNWNENLFRLLLI